MDKSDIKRHSLFYGLNRTKLPIIPVEIEGKNLCFILDTGSTNSIVDTPVAEHFQHLTTHVGKLKITGIEGAGIGVDMITLPFTFNLQTYEVSFCVMSLPDIFNHIEKESGIPIHGLLGVDFLVENKWIIDFHNHIVTY